MLWNNIEWRMIGGMKNSFTKLIQKLIRTWNWFWSIAFTEIGTLESNNAIKPKTVTYPVALIILDATQDSPAYSYHPASIFYKPDDE